MAKAKVQFLCRSCGSVQARWMGKCPDCGTWDALEEYRIPKESRDQQKGVAEGWSPDGEAAGGPPRAVPIGHAIAPDALKGRIATGIGELDRVLGGGLVPGCAVLVGGDPGIGKSTLMLQALGALAARGVRTLYVSAEESAEQVRLRGERLNVAQHPELLVLADTNLARIVDQASRNAPAVMVIDSIQMIYKGDLDASPGSITQLRRCCTELVYLAKAAGVCVLLVGHVTKDGQLAGPRLLEHLVDVVLYFEGDRYHAHRVVRAIKNRFGTTLEIGLFEMGDVGLIEVPDGASLAAGTWGDAPRPGSVVCPAQMGNRCVLVELQALTATGFPGNCKRKASGIDPNRLSMLIAILEQHAGMRLYDRDVFTSAVGGVRLTEPAADLALALAIAGAHQRKALDPRTCAVGEVGLGGEVRPVGHMEARLREAARLGYTKVLTPAARSPRERRDPVGRASRPSREDSGSVARASSPSASPAPVIEPKGIEVIPVRTIAQAIEHLT